MRPLRQVRGLSFPDEAVIRHFFKAGLDKQRGRVLELGCGNGNNLALYQGFGWECHGVDRDQKALADARWNLGDGPQLTRFDMSTEQWPTWDEEPFDALVMANVLCYLTVEQAKRTVGWLNLKSGAHVFIRTRAPTDGRCDGLRECILDTPDERGLYNRFWTADEILVVMPLADPVILRVAFDNPTGGQIIANHDLVIWGRLA
jgi:SAM-dependent methyltransferase